MLLLQLYIYRNDLEKDCKCGCFYCLKIFNPSVIDGWWDHEDTAVCPYCRIDSVIGGVWISHHRTVSERNA